MLGRRTRNQTRTVRRPSPDEQCTDLTKAGTRCTAWRVNGADQCATHIRTNRRPTPQPRRGLTASVTEVELDGVAWRDYRFGDRAWQREAWRLYDITGQLRFVANRYANNVSRCRLYVAEVDDSGEGTKEVQDQQIALLAAGPLGQGPAKDENLRLLAINLFVAGEAWIVAEADGIAEGEDRWFVVSSRQIKRSGGQLTIRRSQLSGGGDMIFRDGEDLILRVWTPHPADTDEPDSPTRSALPDLREIEAIRKREFAELDSRLAGAGILLLSQNLDFPRGDDTPPGIEGFQQTLMRAMAASLQNRASAEAMVPIMATAPDESIDKVKHLTFWSELSSQLLPMRQEAIKSLAQSLDVPAEVLLGIADANHWSAWLITEDEVTTQIEPMLSRIADALTQGYLRGALEALGVDPDRYVYAFDTSVLTVRPNRSADALNYHAAGLLSDDAALAAGAWGEEDKPSDQERIRRLIERAVGGQPALLIDPILGPVVRKVIGLDRVAAPPAPQPAQPAVTPSDDSPALPPAEPRIPTPNSPPEPTPQTEQDTGTAAAIVAVAKSAMLRALSLAGGRLVSHRERDQYPGTARWQLHTCKGTVTRERAEDVLRGAWEDLPAVAEDLHIDPDRLRQLLHEHAVELLTRALPYDGDQLREVVLRAYLTRRLAKVLAVAAA